VDRRSAGNLITSIESIRAHLDRGAPWDACDVFRETAAAHSDDSRLLYWGALAHARAGATCTAHALLDRAHAHANEDRAHLVEILSLRGRLWKDALERASGTASAKIPGERAREEYLRAFAIARDPYPGINAATLSMLLGRADEAKRLAAEVAAQLKSAPSSLGIWDLATLGEAELLLGHFDAAGERYAAAYSLASASAGVIATMRRQIRLLGRVIPCANEILTLMRAPDVVAFAGHMIDADGRAVPRFPASLEPAVAAALRNQVAHLHKPIVYMSAACGADLIFAEAALDAQAEVNFVLPFDRADFVRTSVAVGGDVWVNRFDSALKRAKRVIMATEEGYLGDNPLFEHAALLVDGLTVLRAAQLQTKPTLLCVMDEGDGAPVGGTRATVARWKRTIGTPIMIDLCALRAKLGAQPAHAASHRPSAVQSVDRAEHTTTPQAARPPRLLRTMMFADFAGYSRLHDAFVPLFQQSFFEIGALLIEQTGIRVLEAKTWGDALYAVFDSAPDGAEFALRFLERMQDVDWTSTGLSGESHVRIALHAGPVFRAHDPVMHADGHFGTAVVRAARIEPVTPPGMVYASEAFAATLAAAGSHDYLLEYVGTLALAKAYGESRIYRLDRCRHP